MELDNVNISDTLLVMNKLNSRPRKIYGFKTPNYLFSKYIRDNISNKQNIMSHFVFLNWLRLLSIERIDELFIRQQKILIT
jgi:hypothetical protein